MTDKKVSKKEATAPVVVEAARPALTGQERTAEEAKAAVLATEA